MEPVLFLGQQPGGELAELRGVGCLGRDQLPCRRGPPGCLHLGQRVASSQPHGVAVDEEAAGAGSKPVEDVLRREVAHHDAESVQPVHGLGHFGQQEQPLLRSRQRNLRAVDVLVGVQQELQSCHPFRAGRGHEEVPRHQPHQEPAGAAGSVLDDRRRPAGVLAEPARVRLVQLGREVRHLSQHTDVQPGPDLGLVTLVGDLPLLVDPPVRHAEDLALAALPERLLAEVQLLLPDRRRHPRCRHVQPPAGCRRCQTASSVRSSSKVSLEKSSRCANSSAGGGAASRSAKNRPT